MDFTHLLLTILRGFPSIIVNCLGWGVGHIAPSPSTPTWRKNVGIGGCPPSEGFTGLESG